MWQGIVPCHIRGREYNAISIGRCMKRLGFETKKIRGVIKYLVTKVDPDLHNRENKEDSKLFVPDTFWNHPKRVEMISIYLRK